VDCEEMIGFSCLQDLKIATLQDLWLS
jgi:hypothetical protein